MPTRAVFYKGERIPGGTSTDENVLQTPTDSANSDYEVLLSSTADNVERTEGARKTQHIKFNPFSKLLKLTGHLYDKWGLQTSRSLFQSEFDNLTQSEQDNGTTYYIKDGVPLRICDYIYPVGAIYMSVNNISPAILFGGTWERIEDKFLLAAGSTYNAGATGGEATHTHEYGIQMRDFFAGTNWQSNDSASGALKYDENKNITIATSKTNMGASSTTLNSSITNAGKTVSADSLRSIGNTEYVSNMPPYLVVNVWMRVPDPVEQEEEEGE